MDPHLVTTPAGAPQPVIAQVLFLDVVAYGKLSMGEQLGVHFQLTDLVRNSGEYRQSKGKDAVICRPTGDGMAVVFFSNLLAPIRCALEIDANVKKHPRIRLRMGIHSGPVYRTTDINGQDDVAGDAIVTAQRVMDAGDANHILLSRAMAEILIPLGDWNEYILEIGPVEIKHGGQAFLYNFLGREFGNPNCPRRTLAVAKSEQPVRSDSTPASADQGSSRTKAVPRPNTTLLQANKPRRERPQDCWNCGMMLLPDSVDCIHCGTNNP